VAAALCFASVAIALSIPKVREGDGDGVGGDREGVGRVVDASAER